MPLIGGGFSQRLLRPLKSVSVPSFVKFDNHCLTLVVKVLLDPAKLVSKPTLEVFANGQKRCPLVVPVALQTMG